MSLEIINIKTDKDKYIYGEDTEIKLSFEIISNDKEYELNGVYIEYGINFNPDGGVGYKSHKKINISQKESFHNGDIKKYSCNIPLEYPNLKIQRNSFYELELKNYIKIIADIKLNLFDCKKEYFPDFFLKEEDIDSLLPKKSSILLDLYEQVEKLRVYTNKEKYDEITKEIDILFKDEEYDGYMEYESEKIEELQKEQEKYYHISDKISFNILQKRIQDEIKSKYGTEKDEETLIQIGNGFLPKDYINKDFYEYLLRNYRSFRISRIFPISINIVYSLIALGIISSLAYYYKINNSYVIYFTIFLVFIFQTIDFAGLKKIKNDIFKIKFKDKKYISEKLLNKQLKFEDVFDIVDINYSGDYSCDFSVDLKCVITFLKTEGKHTYEYKNTFWNINLGKYSGNKLSLANIEKRENLDILNKIFIQPLDLDDVKIDYILSYNFYSSELVDISDEIELF